MCDRRKNARENPRQRTTLVIIAVRFPNRLNHRQQTSCNTRPPLNRHRTREVRSACDPAVALGEATADFEMLHDLVGQFIQGIVKRV